MKIEQLISGSWHAKGFNYVIFFIAEEEEEFHRVCKYLTQIYNTDGKEDKDKWYIDYDLWGMTPTIIFREITAVDTTVMCLL